MSLFRPLSEWPLLICGPVLRRVEPGSVSVFVATREACTIALVVKAAGKPDQTSAPQATRALGVRLHLTVVSLTLAAAEVLVPEVVYSYDIQMTPTSTPGAAARTLAGQAGLLSGNTPLGYQQNALPTFSLPTAQPSLHLVHASCRKPHGGGPDSLVIVDNLIAQAHDNSWIRGTPDDARRRPHQLLLTGDQIYADDVAVTLLPVLIDVGGILRGETLHERFPPDDTAMADSRVSPGAKRAAWLKEHAYLSSGAADNHLMYLAEFYAMYMLAWSDELWARDSAGVPQLDPFELTDYYDPILNWALNRKARKDLAARTEVLSFAGSVRRVRRVLANVPTMMMMDDHEVSDDWNLDLRWRNESRSNAVTHRIVRNGLLAQTVFQAWGNQPDHFQIGPGKALLDLVTVPTDVLASPVDLNDAAADVLLDLVPGKTTDPAQRVQWDWAIDGPEHRVIALDSRTHRDYTAPGRRGAALLSGREMQRQLSDHKKDIGDRLCFVIAPAPVMGHPVVEEAVQPLVARVADSRAADSEAWSVNRTGFEAFLRRLAEFGRVVVLSGDVHHGYTNHTAYFGANQLPPARIVQLCSSAVKNSDGLTRTMQNIGMLGITKRGWFGLSTPLPADTRWKLLEAMEGALGAFPGSSIRQDLYFGLVVNERLKPPPVIPSGPWFMDTAVELVRSLTTPAKAGDWCYQVTYVPDVRTPTERRTDSSINDPASISKAALKMIDVAGQWVVGEPNVGQIRLQLAEGRLEVVHRLYWSPPGMDAATAPVVYTKHIAPLSAPAPSEQPQVTL